MSTPETPASSIVSLRAVYFSFSFLRTLPFGKINLLLQRREVTTQSSNSLSFRLIGIVPALVIFFPDLPLFIVVCNFFTPISFLMPLCSACLLFSFAMPYLFLYSLSTHFESIIFLSWRKLLFGSDCG